MSADVRGELASDDEAVDGGMLSGLPPPNPRPFTSLCGRSPLGDRRNDFSVTSGERPKLEGRGGREFSISYLYSGLLYSWISQMACI